MNYYNEIDPKAAAWLRVLIEENQIPPGQVDERSITDVTPTDLAGFTQCHFFAGIGGWSYALRLAGWPADRAVWTGSCPCQPFSIAGKGMGIFDPRHLWPYFRNLIGQCRPPIVFGEQVASAAGRSWLAGISADLETLAYPLIAADLCAAGIGAPHIRQRLFWMAHAQSGMHGRNLQRPAQSPETDESRTRNQPARPGDTGWMDNSTDQRTERTISAQPCSDGPQDGLSWSPGPTSGMGNPISAGQCGGDQFGPGTCGKQMAEQKDGPHSPDQPGHGCQDAGGLAHDERAGQQGRLPWGAHEERQDFNGCLGRGGATGYWSDYDIIHCLDGKSRRIEPGTFPLAHGFPARVAVLKGFGNAIVPQVAAEFIIATAQTLKIPLVTAAQI